MSIFSIHEPKRFITGALVTICALLAMTQSLELSYSVNSAFSKEWGNAALVLDLFKALGFTVAVILFGIGGWFILGAVGVTGATIVLLAFSWAAVSGHMAQITAKAEAETYKSSKAYELKVTAVEKADALMRNNARYASAELADNARQQLNALSDDYNSAFAGFAKYCSGKIDGYYYPQQDSRGQKYTTLCNEKAAALKSVTATMQGWQEIIDGHIAWQGAKDNKAAAESNLNNAEAYGANSSGDYADPMFKHIAFIFQNKGNSEAVKEAYISLLAFMLELLGSVGMAIGFFLMFGKTSWKPNHAKAVKKLQAAGLTPQEIAIHLQVHGNTIGMSEHSKAGYTAAMAGVKPSACPFSDTEAKKQWRMGFDRGVLDHATLNPQPLNQQNTPETAINQPKVEGVEGVERALPVVAFKGNEVEHVEETMLMTPHTRQGDFNLIHAGEGTGKTFLMLAMSHTFASGGQMFGGKWRAEFPQKVLYVAGEDGTARMKKRRDTMGIKHKNLAILTNDLLSADDFPAIHETHGQKIIEANLNGATILVLDNLGVLGDEAQKSSTKWSAISRWINGLNAKGITVWLVHHDRKGKDDFDGLSIIAKTPAVRIHMYRHHQAQAGETLNVLEYKKHRDMHGDECAPITALFDGVQWVDMTDSEDTDTTTGTPTKTASVIDLTQYAKPGKTNNETVWNTKKALEADGITSGPVTLEAATGLHRGTCSKELKAGDKSETGDDIGFGNMIAA